MDLTLQQGMTMARLTGGRRSRSLPLRGLLRAIIFPLRGLPRSLRDLLPLKGLLWWLALLACPRLAVAIEPIRTPCFGDTVVETASSSTIEDVRRGEWNMVATDSLRTTPRQSGTVDTLWVYLSIAAGSAYTGTVRCAIYDTNSFGINAPLRAVTEERSFSSNSLGNWFGFKFTSPPFVVAGDDYELCAWASTDAVGSCAMVRKTGAGSPSPRFNNESVTYNGTWPDPWNAGAAATQVASIYAHLVVTSAKNMPRRRKMIELGSGG